MERSIFSQLDDLTKGFISPTRFVRTTRVSKYLVDRIGLEAELEGHQGCVNCLEWNDQGTILASGSDDCSVLLWDPFHNKSLHRIRSGHTGNIFSVKFLSNLNDHLLVSGAADSEIRVHDLGLSQTRHIFKCHSNRIKNLANNPSEPYLFWSASEDGTVRQFDLRDPTQAMSSRNVLVNLHAIIGTYAEAKSVSVNRLRSEQLAVGSNDAFVRLYDRRKLTLCTYCREPSSRLRRLAGFEDMPMDAAQYLVPGHLPGTDFFSRVCYRNFNTTSVAFSPTGSELLINMGGDHIYLFKLDSPDMPYTCAASQEDEETPGLLFRASPHWISSVGDPCRKQTMDSNIYSHGNVRSDHLSNKSFKSASLKAARLVQARAYIAATRAYNNIIQKWSTSAELYTGRATALYKRGWVGDVYSALRDLSIACNLSQIDSSEVHLQNTRATAALMSVRCLLRLGWIKESRILLKRIAESFPTVVPTNSDSNDATEQSYSASTTPSVARLSANADAQSLRPSDLRHIFNILDKEVKLKEIKLEKLRGSVKAEKSHECAATNEGRDVDSEPVPMDTSECTLITGPRTRLLACSCVRCITDRVNHENSYERAWRKRSYDYSKRYVGHCDAITDIKEANFFGSNGQFIVAGSDCGSFFVWDRQTTNTIRILSADSSTVNCVKPHPSLCLLATSGIDPVVRLWSPKPDGELDTARVIVDHVGVAERNQLRTIADPLEVMLHNMGYRVATLDDRMRRVQTRREDRRERREAELNAITSDERMNADDDFYSDGHISQNECNRSCRLRETVSSPASMESAGANMSVSDVYSCSQFTQSTQRPDPELQPTVASSMFENDSGASNASTDDDAEDPSTSSFLRRRGEADEADTSFGSRFLRSGAPFIAFRSALSSSSNVSGSGQEQPSETLSGQNQEHSERNENLDHMVLGFPCRTS